MKAELERRHALACEIVALKERLRDLERDQRAADDRLARRTPVESWLAFLLLLVIVAGAGVWLGVAVRAGGQGEPCAQAFWQD